MVRPLLIIVIVFAVFSCSKKESGSDGIDPADKEKAAAMIVFLESNKFELTKYYSETPIDYIDTDMVVRAETDLWRYVSPWLHDDLYNFNASGNVTIEQGAIKFPTDSSVNLTRNYAVSADKNGVAFNFIGHEYQDLKYRLLQFNDTMLRVSATWHEKTVISEFHTTP